MNYTDFIKAVRDHIADFLPEEFADAEISVVENIKNNDCFMDGLVVKTQENVSPIIYLMPFYEMVENGEGLGNVLPRIAETYVRYSNDFNLDIPEFLEYDKIKQNIVCKLINHDVNEQYLSDKPHTDVADLSVIYQILLNPTNDCREKVSIAITKELMFRYGVSVEMLHEQALSNMRSLDPPCFMKITDKLREMLAADLVGHHSIPMDQAQNIASQMIADMPEDVYVLTNTSGIDGAAEILQEEIRHKIADTIGDFFVLPSSLHEVIIIPKSNRDTPEELACIVQEVNETQVSPEERLSNHIYEYSSSEQNYKRVSLKAAS